MPRYVVKILMDLEARDDLEARQRASTMVSRLQVSLEGVREIVLQSPSDQKSIRMNVDGSFQGQWNRGGRGEFPGKVDA
jgi:hypothetical protein